MRPGPSLAVTLVPRYLDLTDKPIRARDLLQRIAQNEGWIADTDELVERAETWEPLFLRRVRAELSELNKLGRFSAFAMNSSDPNHLQGSAFVEPRDSPAIAATKNKRAHMAEYSIALAALSPSEFEVLCAGVLSLLGAESVRVTPYSADDGIDFYGVVRRRRTPDRGLGGAVFDLSQQVSIWLLGQAKHYSRAHVGTPDLRHLVGSVELAKSGVSGSANRRYEDLKIRVCDPTLVLFFTTGTVTSAGWRVAESSGVVTLDGEMLASLLAENEIGVKDGRYSDTAFSAWIREQS